VILISDVVLLLFVFEFSQIPCLIC